MKISITLLMIILTTISGAQGVLDYSKYDWDESFDANKYANALNHKEDATIALHRQIIKPGLFRKTTIHRIIWIEKETAIDYFNKLLIDGFRCIPGQTSKLTLKVRLIDQNNTTTDLINYKGFCNDQKGELQNNWSSESGSSVVAIPGIQKKCWLEIYYSFGLAIPDTFKNQIFIDEPYDVALAQIIFEEKEQKADKNGVIEKLSNGYNGFSVSAEGNKSFKVYEVLNVKSKKNEVYKNQFKSIPRVDCQVVNKSWQQIGKDNYYLFLPFYYGTESIGLQKEYVKIADQLGITNSSGEEKIIAFENYIKSTCVIGPEELRSKEMMNIIETRYGDKTGMAKVYHHFFREMGIDCKLYFASDQDYINLDKDFPFEPSLQEYIFYFPKYDTYLLPGDKYHRAGKIPAFLSGCNAFLIPEKKENGSKDDIIDLPFAVKENNYQETNAHVIFNLEQSIATVNLTKKRYGDVATEMRTVLFYSDDEKAEDYVKRILVDKMEKTSISEIHFKNKSLERVDFDNDTLSINCRMKSEDIIKPLGDSYIIELPTLIGSQISFYGNDERVSEIYIEESKVYHHQLKLEIPTGYHIEGIENHDFNRSLNVDGKTAASFGSKAKIDGNMLILTVDEFYEFGYYAPEFIKEFQAVINAAYEFYISKSRLVKN